jgi:glucose-specific phosphotransferase system IIA component
MSFFIIQRGFITNFFKLKEGGREVFGFLKKDSKDIVAPVTGTCIAITEVEDKVFSSKAMGDGFAVVPEDDTIVSPITGEIVMTFPTKHAFGVKSKEDVEILVHIGIDTVNLNGEGFTMLAKEGAKVKAGDPIVRVDRTALTQKGVNLTTMVVFTGGYEKEVNLDTCGQKVEAGQVLIQG